MSVRAVLVTSHDQSGTLISRSSAVACGDIILLHGIHLLPLLEQTRWKKLFNSILQSIHHNTEACAFIDADIRFTISEEENDENFLPDAIERTGRTVVTAGIWRCSMLEKSLDIFQFDGGAIVDDSFFRCLSIFVFLKIPGNTGVPLIQSIVHLLHNLEVPVRGRKVLIESTPGGIQVFINSWSHGVIARVCGRQGCMFLTDAIVHRESSGAPVYNALHSRCDAITRGSLLGVALGRIGDLNDFTYGISLLPVLRNMVLGHVMHPRVIHHSNVVELVDETVVMVFSGELQGSGVVVDARRSVILTCSHVIQTDVTEVKIFHRGNIFMGQVIECSRECDLAVLKAPPNSFVKNMDWAESPMQIGDFVHLAGFPYVLPFRDYNVRPFISQGYISKSMPYVLIINCSVSKGISGGAVIRNGKLAGSLLDVITVMEESLQIVVDDFFFNVTGNNRHTENILKYIETEDIDHLKYLKSVDGNVYRFWNMGRGKL